MQLPPTYSDMSFISCSYAFLWIYSQRSLSLLRRDWTNCWSLVCTGHVARESTHLWGGEETKRFDGYFLCNEKVVIIYKEIPFPFLTSIWIISLNFATDKNISLHTTEVHVFIYSKSCIYLFQIVYEYTCFHPDKKEPKRISMMSSRPNSTSKQKTGTSFKQ